MPLQQFRYEKWWFQRGVLGMIACGRGVMGVMYNQERRTWLGEDYWCCEMPAQLRMACSMNGLDFWYFWQLGKPLTA